MLIIEKQNLVQPDVLVIWFVRVSGENEDLLGVDETPITNIQWIAIEVVENKVYDSNFFLLVTNLISTNFCFFIWSNFYSFYFLFRGINTTVFVQHICL